MISVVSQHVIGFTCHNESMLIGLFRQRQFADERKWLFVSADVCGAGTCDDTLRTSAWEATLTPANSADNARYTAKDPFIQSMLFHTISTRICIRSAFFLRRIQTCGWNVGFLK